MEKEVNVMQKEITNCPAIQQGFSLDILCSIICCLQRCCQKVGAPERNGEGHSEIQIALVHHSQLTVNSSFNTQIPGKSYSLRNLSHGHLCSIKLQEEAWLPAHLVFLFFHPNRSAGPVQLLSSKRSS